MIDSNTGLTKQVNSQKLHEAKPQSLHTTKSLLSVSKLSSWIEIVDLNKKIDTDKKLQSEEEEHQLEDNDESKSSKSVILNEKLEEANESWGNVNQKLICIEAQQFIEENKSLVKFSGLVSFLFYPCLSIYLFFHE